MLQCCDISSTEAWVKGCPCGVKYTTKASSPTRAFALASALANGSTFITMPGPPPKGRSSTVPCLSVVKSRGLTRSEEHTSELQSRFDLVCRLLLEKKNT